MSSAKASRVSNPAPKMPAPTTAMLQPAHGTRTFRSTSIPPQGSNADATATVRLRSHSFSDNRGHDHHRLPWPPSSSAQVRRPASFRAVTSEHPRELGLKPGLAAQRVRSVVALTRVHHEACLSEDLACSAPLDSGRSSTRLGGIEERVTSPPAPRRTSAGPGRDPLVALRLIDMFSALLGAIVLRPTLRYLSRRAASEISGVRWREPT